MASTSGVAEAATKSFPSSIHTWVSYTLQCYVCQQPEIRFSEVDARQVELIEWRVCYSGPYTAVVSANRSTREECTDVDSNMDRQWNPSRTRGFRDRATKARFFRRMDTEPAGQHPQPRRCRRAERCRANRSPRSNLPLMLMRMGGKSPVEEALDIADSICEGGG